MGELLGEGGTGTVYAAVNSRGEDVAIKFLRESLSDDPEMVARFRREASIAQRVRSEFIAQLVGAGRTADSYWIAYRRIHGETLSSRLRRDRVVDPASLVSFVDQILLGLAVAHAAGVVHRDIKPGNIMVETTATSERACILDFGISKNRSPGTTRTWQESLTSATATLGTINYMPPEQVGGSASVDQRADLYSVAVVAYRALSGQLPYGGTSQAAVLHAKLNADARRLGTTTCLTWPPSLEAFFEQTLARDPGERFDNAPAMGAAWRQVMASPGMPAAGALRKRIADSQDSDDSVLEGAPTTR